MVRKDVMRTAQVSMRKNRQLLRLLANEDIADRKILHRELQ